MHDIHSSFRWLHRYLFFFSAVSILESSHPDSKILLSTRFFGHRCISLVEVIISWVVFILKMRDKLQFNGYGPENNPNHISAWGAQKKKDEKNWTGFQIKCKKPAYNNKHNDREIFCYLEIWWLTTLYDGFMIASWSKSPVVIDRNCDYSN